MYDISHRLYIISTSADRVDTLTLLSFSAELEKIQKKINKKRNSYWTNDLEKDTLNSIQRQLDLALKNVKNKL